MAKQVNKKPAERNEEKKLAKQSSDLFHNIMKASVSGNPKPATNYPPEICPICSLEGKFMPPSKQKGKSLIVTFLCPNKHSFQKVVPLK